MRLRTLHPPLWFGVRLRTRLLNVLSRFSGRGRRSLVTRLLLLLMTGAGIIYLVAMAGLWWTASGLMEQSLEKQAMQWIAEMDELGPPVYGAKGKRDILFIENRIRNFPEIAFVRYYDATGKHVLREYGPAAAHIPLLTARQLERLSKKTTGNDRPFLFDGDVPVSSSTWLGGHYVRAISPVRIRSIRSDGLLNFNLDNGGTQGETVKIIGYIDLGIDPNVYRGGIARSIALASLIAAIVFLGALVLGRGLIRRALMPLTDLQDPLARLATGDVNVSVDTRGDVEIVAIGRALNATISALRERDAKLRRLAEQDWLTGLPNRGCFSRLLEAEVARAKLGEASSALLFIDLDRFKYVNDVLGHAGGDRLLVQVAELIKGRVRSSDVVARFGGDEFTVLVRDVSREGAIELAKVLNDLMRDFYFSGHEKDFTVYCSIGVAMITPECSGAEEVLLQADTACYEAKSGGRNRYHIFEPDQQVISSTLKDISWSALIKRALREDTFRLVYQPIVSLSGPRQEYYEVLVRMPDEEGNLVTPTVFLHIAERFGLLAEMDRWVITQAMKALAEFRAEGRDITFSINLSGQAFEDPAIAQLIKRNLRLFGLPAGSVVFEITEQIAVRYMEKARRMMQSLIDLGVRFSLDDFGVGFSSFNYLKHFPVTFIKIDGSFVENMADDPTDQAMVRSIAQIARALGKRVIAEFVQDNETINLLKQYHVDYVQGNHVGRPSPNVPHRRFARLAQVHVRKKGTARA